MDDMLTQLLANYLVWNPIVNEPTKYDVTTDEGYQKAVELIAEARKAYDNAAVKSFFDNVLNGSFCDFLDSLYKEVVKSHDAAVKQREEEAAKTDFDRLSDVDRQNVNNAVEKYIEKYTNASPETIEQAKDILRDYTAWVIRTTRDAKDELSKDTPCENKKTIF